LDTILKNTFVILQKSQDNREKLAAMELFKNTHLVKLELLSNVTTIDHAWSTSEASSESTRTKRKTTMTPMTAKLLLMQPPIRQVSNQSSRQTDMFYDNGHSPGLTLYTSFRCRMYD